MVMEWDAVAPVTARRRRPADEGLSWQTTPSRQPWRVIQIGHLILFTQAERTVSPAVMSAVPNAEPVNFARAVNGDLYFTNGLIPMTKWDGVRFTAQPVGVSPPTQALAVATTGPGTISGTYTAYERFLDADGNPSNLSPVSNTVAPVKAKTFTYANVQAPTDPKVVRRQILRNTTGQAVTYYVDVDTTDLSSTTFTSTLSDTDLANNLPVPLFDGNGDSLANRYTVPPSHKPVLVAYLDRMFAAGNVVYQQGHAEVTNGSATVNGVGTQWTAALAGRFFYAVGGGSHYQIQSVNVAAQTLTLTGVYNEASDPFAVYVIEPAPAERNLIYFSEAGLPEAWPATNALSIEETGDDVTALLVADSFLYIFQRQRTFRLTYHVGPDVDGAVFPAGRRGCVNQRCWVYVDDAGYILDQQGIYKFDAGGGAQTISAAIQDLFMLDKGDQGLHVNWAASKWFHACHSPDERAVRWFVALSGDRLPRNAICFNYDSNFWWIEQYAFPVGSSVLMDYPLLRPAVSGPARRVFAQGFGSLDGPDPASGTTRAGASQGLADGLAGPPSVVYPPAGVLGSPVAIYDGRGKGQVNVVRSVNGPTVRCVQPWLVRPDATSKFQLGGFAWTWQSGLFNWLDEEGDEPRRVKVMFPPTLTPAQCDLRFYPEFSNTAEPYGYTWPTTSAELDSVRITEGQSDAVIDMTFQYGMAQVRRSGRRERYVQHADWFSIELAGVSAESPVVVYEIDLEGAVQ